MPRGFRAVVIIGVAVVLGLTAQRYVRDRVMAPRPPIEAEMGASIDDFRVADVFATDLDIPWDLAFLPNGDILVTELPGRLVRLAPDGTRRWSTEVPGVRHRGDGGLMGVVADPAFAENGHVYLFLTSDVDNRVERWTVGPEGELGDRTVLLEGIPASGHDNGGRLALGPDSMLYAATGDVGHEEYPRERESLAGKILRMTLDGDPAEGNPFGDYVWSYGHRNPQGMAWSPDSTMWSVEPGHSGFRPGHDELNRVEPGRDYGYPEAHGHERVDDLVPSVLDSGQEHVWSPSGAAWWNDRLFFGGLDGEALYEARFIRPTSPPRLITHFHEDFGRIRQVKVGPDGMLWVLTSNRDVLGNPHYGDDRIIRVDPERLR